MEHIDTLLQFWFRTSFPPPNDTPFRSHWFRATPDQDEEMNHTFSQLYEQVLEDEQLRTQWETTRAGRMALLILLDQLPRNMFRGTSRMFASDSLALPLALKMVQQEDLTAMEKMFVFMAIQHAESLEYAIMAEDGLKALVKSLANDKQQRKFMRLLPSARAHVTMLEQFGRYCHRNDILGRPSTDEEKKFLSTASNNFIKSVKNGAKSSNAQSSQSQKDNKPAYDLPNRISPMRVLLLHGFRQNATTIRDALKPLISVLRPYPIEFITLNSPMVYRPGTTPFGDSAVTHPTWTQPAEHLKCWWNASDDGKEYLGWEASVRFIERAWIEKGAWDGVVAFSQGATLASLLSSMSQLSCSHARFAVLISGSPSRATAHKDQLQTKIKGIKTLNIYGKQDHHLGTPEEMKERTLKLSGFFEDAEIFEHGGGHFTPQWWPWDLMAKFILAQGIPMGNESEDVLLTDDFSVDQRLDKLIRRWEAHGKKGRVLPPLYSTELIAKLVSSCLPPRVDGYDGGYSDLRTCDSGSNLQIITTACDEYDLQKGSVSKKLLDDLFVLAFSNHPKFQGNGEDLYFEMLTRLGLTSPEYVIQQFPSIVKYGHWQDLNNLVKANWPFVKSSHPSHANARRIHTAILHFLGTQLQKDAASISSQSNDLTGEDGQGQDFTAVSLAAKYVPRIRGSLDNVTHFARDLALWLRPAKNDAEKLTSYVGYQKLYRSICTVLENTSPDIGNYDKGWDVEAIPKLTIEQRNRILSMPPNTFVKVPEEVPVAPCPLEELEEVIKHLNSNAPLPKDNVKFVRGTLMPVKTPAGSKGVLDMCKQVVGPEGVTPLLDGLRVCKGVEGLLLGNNVTGGKGAREIAKYIKREDSQITTWYLGGNQFGPDAVGVISKALERDSKVLALWLKRNPVMPEGTLHLAKMLRLNQTLTTLDLSNCGVLDEGCIDLFRVGLMDHPAMKHLYLNTNGITVKGATVIAEYFEKGGNLESLYMSCNPLGDEGVRILAKSLKGNTHLVRLGLSSCAIGDIGIKALIEVLPTIPNLQWLNLGFLKGTYIFNGLPNYLGLNGVKLLCSVIPRMPSLRYLDICHNQIPPEGLQLLDTTLRSLPEGQGLVALLSAQFGQQHSELVDNQLKATLARNTLLWGKKVVGGEDQKEWQGVGEQMAQRSICPDHVKEIMSTTRNMD